MAGPNEKTSTKGTHGGTQRKNQYCDPQTCYRLDFIKTIIFTKKIQNQLQKNLNKEKKSTKLNLNLNSRVEKVITSKDEKGNPKRFSIKIIINLEVYEGEKLKRNANFEENFEYNNRSNKFDLKQYEKNIKDNLISELSYEIIRYLNSLK